MFWLGVLAFVFAWAIALLVWACCAVSKEGDEALEELDESLRRLQEVATSVARTTGRSAELMRQRAPNPTFACRYDGRSHPAATALKNTRRLGCGITRRRLTPRKALGRRIAY